MDRTHATPAPAVAAPLAGSLGGGVLPLRGGDVSADRERRRLRRLWRIATVLGIPTALLWWRLLAGHPVDFFQLPHIDPLVLVPSLFFIVLLLVLVGQFVLTGRSPHVLYRPEQIGVTLDDVVGIDVVKEEVVRSLNLFLAHRTFATEMGGSARRGVLFEGAPGTGKTYTAKAMAREAGVPFLFVSATSFQSMFYGATAKKIRSYFKALRKVAQREGGAIGFIEEIDAIAVRRNGLSMTPLPDVAAATGLLSCGGLTGLPSRWSRVAGSGPVSHPYVSEGTGGVVNELLVQMQSFDEPVGLARLQGKVVDALNLLLPAHRQLRKPVVPPTNVLLVAATNRADSLDPALLRPGRFDKTLSFELPDKRGRRHLVDHFLTRKAHAAELDTDERRDALAAVTQGYSPVMIEHLFDEALVNALRRGSREMDWRDLERARLTEEVGLGQPVGYTDHERRLIATHEAGHATAAYLVAPERRLEILTIVKRRSALGLLAHGDRDEVYTRSRTEMLGLVQIALAGQCAEEIFFGDISTGPSGDLLYATNVAAEMVGAAGMGDTLVSYAAIRSGAFNESNIAGRVLADGEGRARVEAMLRAQKDVIRELLAEHRHLVEALRDALLDRHELVGTEITDVLDEARAAAPGGTVVDLTAAERTERHRR